MQLIISKLCVTLRPIFVYCLVFPVSVVCRSMNCMLLMLLLLPNYVCHCELCCLCDKTSNGTKRMSCQTQMSLDVLL